MKNKTITLTSIAIVSLIVSCSNPEIKETEEKPKVYTELAKAEWIIGKWQNISDRGNAYENWVRKDDSTLTGKSFFVVGKDTVSSEALSCEQRGNDLFYIPTVKDQNQGKPILFTMTMANDSQLIFENPKHDFPQKISYKRIGNDSLLAEISGMMDGKLNSQQFSMGRVK